MPLLKQIAPVLPRYWNLFFLKKKEYLSRRRDDLREYVGVGTSPGGKGSVFRDAVKGIVKGVTMEAKEVAKRVAKEASKGALEGALKALAIALDRWRGVQ